MRNSSFITALVLLVVTGAASSLLAYRSTPVVVATNLEKIPMEIDGYRAIEDTFPESVYKELNADKHLYRHYRAADGSVIDLYIGYYGTAKGGRTGHNPYSCLPGAGAAILETRGVKVPVDGKEITLNYIMSKKDDTKLIMFHWYQSAGRNIVTSGVKQNLKRFVGKILYNRNDGAFISLTTVAPDNDIKAAEQRLVSFAANTIGLLPVFWPVEK